MIRTLLHSDRPARFDGVLLLILAGLAGWFANDNHGVSSAVGVAVGYAIVILDRLAHR